MKRIVDGCIALAAVVLLVCGSAAFADTITLDIPELVGTFTHGQEPVQVVVDFGTDFQPLWGITLEITATGIPSGFGWAGSIPAELLVSVVGGFEWLSPTLFGPYGETPTTDSKLAGYGWPAIDPAPITSGQAVITIDTPLGEEDESSPAEIEIISATITADFYPAIVGYADINDDGFVGLADLDILLGHWNQIVNPSDRMAGDLTGDGFVGLTDLDIVLERWNAGTPPAVVVPEPGMVLIAFIYGGLVTHHRHR